MKIRRILSLDGGGIKGVFPAAFLANIEEQIEAPIGKYFDLIVGTSTGGILALGLGLGYSAKELLKFYEDLGPKVFTSSLPMKLLRRLGFPKYSPAPLRRALANKFGKRKLGESSTRLMIPSMNMDSGEVHVFKTAHHPRLERDYKESVVEVAMATAAAPTYFPPHMSSSGIPFIDGGMWANSPVGFAVVEAIGVLGWERTTLEVLSLGCTATPFNQQLSWSLGSGELFWARKTSHTFMSGQESGSIGIAKLLAGEEHIHRYNPIVAGGKFSLDGIKGIPTLKGFGSSEARKALPKIKPLFFAEPTEPFSPFHRLPVKNSTEDKA
ncbi:MAG: hypothetical protein A2234_05065 [Elusimicrobia bacterium RIFOXYA2_FULL_58_8]|nr:MAG: hypothetical protein A2234_05065 [Elusimicrobia bacterium RIFOXYA2_FULL_58_8]OGS13441.1 MAG: hypothetical protein A2285_07290 [Elusimicrobia bacterium RIFOXYA12_FULL_57_11]